MFKVIEKSGDEIKILDTNDGSVDVCSINDIKEYIRLRLDVQGVLFVHGNVLIARIENNIYGGLKPVFNRNIEQDWNSGSLKFKGDTAGSEFELKGFNSYSNKSDIYARYEGYCNKQYICSVDECVRASSSRITIPRISYYAIFDENKDIVRYINCNGLDSSVRTRANKQGRGSFIDIKGKINDVYFCNIFNGDDLLDELVSIMILNNREIVYITACCYEGKDDNGEFSKSKYTTRRYDANSGKSSFITSFWDNDCEDYDIGINLDSVVEIYGSNFTGVGKTYGSLSSFVDTYAL